MASFGNGKAIPLQGKPIGSGAPTQKSKTSGVPGKGASSTPGLTKDASKANVRPKPQGGSGTKNTGGPKPFKA